MRIEEIRKEIKKYSEELDMVINPREDYPPELDYSKNEYPDYVEILAEKIAELERKLRGFEYSDEESLRRKEINELIFNEGYIIRDSESTNDLLSRTQHAHEISKLISNKKTLSPLTLGIYGPWGEGKSSFLRLIETELDNINVKIKND
ncbi:KAP family NTPase [Peribacillus butanolivorans]|uniref:P-loop NTPase fold protein n=1 Tax=Peribacillus butanolivorans TaxID=421767 RepID=UPI0030C93204